MFHFKAITHILGILLFLNGLFMASILPVAWLLNSSDISPILISAVVSANIGILLWWLTKNSNKDS